MLLLSLIGAVAVQGSSIVKLGQPCRTKNVLSGCCVVDRGDGRERLALGNMNESGGAEIIYIDFEKDTAQYYPSGAGQGSWGLMEVPGDRLLMPTYHQGWYVVFDLKTMQYVKRIEFKPEGYIWTAAIGGDGRVYGGTYPGAKLAALDLNTYEIEDCGAPSPSNTYLRTVAAMPDGRIMCNFGYVKPEVLLYDPKTKKFDPLPEQMSNPGDGYGATSIGVSWQGYFISGSLVFDGKTLNRVDPPFPIPPADKGAWSVHQGLTRGSDYVYIQQNNSIYRWKQGDKKLTELANVDLKNGIVYAATKDGSLLGVRGQDYFVIKPGDTSLHLKPIPGESSPRPIHFLRVDPDGRLWGGPGFAQTLFWLDPKTGKYANTRTISDSGGEPYDAAFWGGAVYAVAYSRGEIIKYDPKADWDQINHKNPRTVADLGAKGYVRPIGTIQLGPDGRLYSGWQAKYGTYGGAVAITDPKTEQTDLIENPLGEQAIAGIAPGDGVVFAGTCLSANGLPEKTGEWARFGVIDINSKKVVFERTFDGAKSVRALGFDLASRRAVVQIDGKMMIFDAKVNGFADIDVPRPQGTIAAIGDGKLYYGAGTSVIALDMASGRYETVVDAGVRVGNVAVDTARRIYFTSGVDVYAVRN